MERTLIAIGVVLAVAVVAYLLGRHRTEPPTQPANPDWPIPAQLDREDFDRPEADWLVALFTSATCNSCALMAKKAAALNCGAVVVQEVSFQTRRDLHDRYGIEAVPCVAVADRDGIVRRGFIGSVTATDLWSAVAEARDPGSTPEGHLGLHRSLSRAPTGPSTDEATDVATDAAADRAADDGSTVPVPSVAPGVPQPAGGAHSSQQPHQSH